MTTVSLQGHPTWALVPPPGPRPVVVLLHGGLSSSDSIRRRLGRRLGRDFAVAAFDRRGHGRTADTREPFTYEAMAEETVAFLELLGRRCHLVGHSDGANVALLVARSRPDLVRRVVAVGANYHYDGLMDFPLLEADDPGFAAWAEQFAAISPDGRRHARAVLEKTNEMYRTGPTMTTRDLAEITTPVLVLVGDDDVATLAHTASLYESLPQGQLAVVPGTSHSVLKERPEECAALITRFLRQRLPVRTYAPIRRARVGEYPGD